MSGAIAADGPVLLRIGATTIPASEAAGLLPAIEAANARSRIPGLPDTLNPDAIDPGKAAAFVASLPGQPAETLARIAGHELSLAQDRLGLIAAAPTRAADFAVPFTLVVDDIRGRHVLAHTTVAADAGLARTRAAEGHAALAEAEEVTRRAEAGRNSDEVGAALRRRAAVAVAWHVNAAAWASAAPGDSVAQDSLAAARDAARRYRRPSGDKDG